MLNMQSNDYISDSFKFEPVLEGFDLNDVGGNDQLGGLTPAQVTMVNQANKQFQEIGVQLSNRQLEWLVLRNSSVEAMLNYYFTNSDLIPDDAALNVAVAPYPIPLAPPKATVTNEFDLGF